MNKETGKIYNAEQMKEIAKLRKRMKRWGGLAKMKRREILGKSLKDPAVDINDLVRIHEDDLTESQRARLQVSKKDNKSKLGKTWTQIWKDKSAGAKLRKRMKRWGGLAK